MNEAEWAAVESAIQEGDVSSVDNLLAYVEKSDYPALIACYQAAAGWPQKDVIAQLLATHSDPSLRPVFLDYMQVPITEEMQMFTLAQVIRHFGEEYDQFQRYFTDYDLLVKALCEILAKHGLERSPEPEEKKADAVSTQKAIPLTDIPLTRRLTDDIAADQLLLAAVERQDMPLLKRAIAQGANVSDRITHKPLTGCSVLMAALNLQQPKMALRLIEAGADVTARRSHQAEINPEQGQTALWWAMFVPDIAVVKALLAAGAPINCPDNYGVTPLLQAVRGGNIAFVKQLLAAGADFQHPCYEGARPLYYAVKAGEIKMVRYLLELGEDVNARHQNGGSALLRATYEGYLDLVKLLLAQGADPNAVHLGIATGLNPSAAQFARMTPLAFAVRSGRVNMVRALIAGGADPNRPVEKPDGTQIALLDFATKKREAIALLLNS